MALQSAAKAKKILAQTDRLVFLGFGFHPNNVQILGLDNIHPRCGAFASAFEMPLGIRTELLTNLHENSPLNTLPETFVINGDCLAAFRAFPIFLENFGLSREG